MDIIFQCGRELTVIEVKSASTYNAALLKGLKNITKLSPSMTQSYLIYAGEKLSFSNDIVALKYNQVEIVFG